MEFGNAAKGNLRFWKASKVEGKPWVCRHLDGDWGQHQRSFQLLEDQSYGVLYVQFWRQIQRCIWPITNVFIIRQRSECWLPSVDINGSQHSSFSGDFECPGKRSETGVWRSLIFGLLTLLGFLWHQPPPSLSLGVCVAQSTALWKTVTCSSMNNLAWGRHTLIAESFCQRRYLVSVLTVVVGVFTFLCSMSSWENMTTPEMVRTSGWSYS